jgi:cell division protein FtsZ
MIFGAVIDPNMGDDIRVTVIATGFERSGVPRRALERPVVQRGVNTSTPFFRPVENASMESQPAPMPPAQPKPTVPAPEFKPQTLNTEDLDIPTFLRNRK